MKKVIFALLLLTCMMPFSLPARADTAPTHVLWTNTDGSISLWNFDATSGAFTYLNYGPFPGWTAKALADGPDGRTRVLWTNVSGQVSLWKLDNTTGIYSHSEFGPFPNWTPTAISASLPVMSALSGPAGGDLFGTYPNPTVAANAIDHTKLASDAASLAQVSGGAITNLNGKVGIGTSNPVSTLDVNGNIWSHGTNFSLVGGGGGAGNNNHNGRALVDAAGRLNINYANDFGWVDIQSDTSVEGNLTVGSGVNASSINVSGNITSGHISTTNGSSFSWNGFTDPAPGTSFAVKAWGGIATDYLYASQDIQAVGTMTAKSLQITGGSDLAEPYKIAASAQVQPLPGLVVSIAPNQTGQMRVCTHAYDNTVGGIISGAGGVQPGVVLRQAGTVADGTLPIASVGRVWCWCDADAGGAITPGDLLTTSDTPGHAMRVCDHDKARGAILGKAMSALKTGKGLVLVLVTLE